ncbi:PRTRC system protein C [Chryseobacterium indologenes]|uniref:PRTRC system protein C n=3 Tax=Chryseobacterium TaxID=59732 RepID=A0A3G6RU03_CHRLC|nr:MULTISPECIES: PRTRC system protein C [Bacteroidota]AZA84582.1 PRTRC system protein C [Chryseobacterium lactis]AZB04970.1 PRTRC system protein C [Chryseobacterium lactis]KMQ64445.1 PRTRC system protein C [Chryseobacterium angstadtii]MBF6643611.1 PRTRC system protein C [Chryseobacterium indologenes]PNW14701.1 PRTRC system protein C [Chryseobacterium lactis]
MLLSVELARVFVLMDKGLKIILDDPEPRWGVDAVMNFYANTYPILTTSKVSAPVIKDDSVVYTFESVMGTKG